MIYFDIESTGLNTETDRIVQLFLIKKEKGVVIWECEYLMNPTIPIPKEASDVHGITNEDVKDMPTFGEYADEIYNLVKGEVLAGQNVINFDIPMLFFEFERSGINWDVSDLVVLDTLKLEWAMKKSNLETLFYEYTGKIMEGAHNAKNDVLANIEVLEGQLKKYGITSINEYVSISTDGKKNLDVAGKVYEVDGIAFFSFGKHKGKAVTEVAKTDASWLKWFQGVANKNTKDVITNILVGK